MVSLPLYLLGLAAPLASTQTTSTLTYDFVSASSSISSYMHSPTFTPYVKPAQKVEEWIALGDSYTSGLGANGVNESFADPAGRGHRSYPMQMRDDKGNWSSINDGDASVSPHMRAIQLYISSPNSCSRVVSLTPTSSQPAMNSVYPS
jgi:hypothetical protein